METLIFDWQAWVILPLLIFAARVFDVTLGTLRIIFVAQGRRYIAPILGGIEVFVWVAAISQLTKSANNVVSYAAYALGFAAGNYIGMLIEDRLAMGTVVLRIILSKGANALCEALRDKGFGVTMVDGQGGSGPVKLLYTVVSRKNLPTVTETIHQVAPQAFFSVEAVRASEKGIFPIAVPGKNSTVAGRKNK